MGKTALITEASIVIPGLMNKLGAQSVRISPRAAVRRITHKLQEG
jgi:hypothetical protein